MVVVCLDGGLARSGFAGRLMIVVQSTQLALAMLSGRLKLACLSWGGRCPQVAEVAFINQMLEQDKKLALQEKMEEGED